MSVPSVTVVLIQRQIDPARAASYFDGSEELIEWRDVRGTLTPGIRIAVLIEVKLDEHNTPYMLAANASCSADAFFPVGLAPEDTELLRQYVGMTIAAAITVRAKTGKQYCHGGRYEIEPQFTLAPLPYNPSDAELAAMVPNSHFVVQGTFVRYYEVTPGKQEADTHDHKTKGFMVIQTPERQITLNTFRPHMRQPKYGGGVLENLRDKLPIPGETLRITGFISKTHGITVGYNYPYLVVPAPERLADYNKLREAVAAKLRTLHSLVVNRCWFLARQYFAHLRTLELTSDESRSNIELMQRVPADERSIFCDRTYEAQELEKAFGVNVEVLNKREFLVFADKVIRGVCENPSSDSSYRTDQSYLFRYLRDEPFVLSDLEALVRTGIWTRLDRLRGRTDERDSYWDDHALLDNCITEVSCTNSSELVEQLILFAEQLMSHGCYDKLDRNACPRRYSGLLWGVFRAIESLKCNNKSAAEVVSKQRLLDWQVQLRAGNASDYTMHLLQGLINLYG